MLNSFFNWLDSRTGYRALVESALHEPLPRGTGWFFTTGSIVTLLVGVQFVTGVGLSMYYVPSPALAYGSVRFIMTGLPLGWLLRGLHFWGASFLVVAAMVHMLRVFLFGSYKAPREVTWLSGVVMLLVILGFALSGYLLPWDQKAYWATTVSINIAKSTPLIGEYVADVLRGGSDLGALTLGRWFSMHALLLPVTLAALIAAHIALMRKHGISGPLKATPGPGSAFFPWHVIKDTLVMAAVFASLITVAFLVPAPLDAIANSADASYVPRPEWYFLSLFQLLKYFPGPLEPVATMVLPGIVIGFLILLPFLDRGVDRHPWAPSRRAFTAAFVAIGAGVSLLTGIGLSDRPRDTTAAVVALDEDAIVAKDIFDTVCFACHKLDGDGGTVGPDLSHVGKHREAATIRKIIEDPLNAFDDSEMPPFEKRLTPDQLDSLARYLALRK